MSARPDYVVEWSTDIALVHDPHCATLSLLRALGEPILTMLQCEAEPPPEWPRHDCLELAPDRSAA